MATAKGWAAVFGEPSSEIGGLARELADLPAAATIEEERSSWDALCAPLDAAEGVSWEPVNVGDVPAVWTAAGDQTDCTILYCHGGAFAIGSPWHNRDMMSRIAAASGARVLAVDYRLAPEHPFPAGLDDTSSAYRWLLESGADPARIVLAGDSCGANLVLGAALRARDGGDPLPAGLICISLWARWRTSSI